MKGLWNRSLAIRLEGVLIPRRPGSQREGSANKGLRSRHADDGAVEAGRPPVLLSYNKLLKEEPKHQPKLMQAG